MATLNDAINKINPQLANITKINLTCDGQKRGSTPKPTGSGVYIYRDGSLSVGSIGAELDIIKHGGNSDWEGAVDNSKSHDPGFTTAQQYMQQAILDHIVKYGDGSKIEVNYEG